LVEVAMSYTATLFNPQQGHVCLMQAWAEAKPQLMAGHKLQLEVKRQKRSTKQNRRYWGNGVLKQIAEQAAPNGRLYDAEIWHEQFKRMFIGVEELPNGQVQGKSSAKLTTTEFSEFCTEVEAYAAQELGVIFYDLEAA
jgi:hypothetical protein